MEKKEYRVPGEIIEKFREERAYRKLVDVYAGKYFGFKRAVKCARVADYLQDDAWLMVRELYPELRDKRLTFYNEENVVRIKDKNLAEEGE